MKVFRPIGLYLHLLLPLAPLLLKFQYISLHMLFLSLLVVFMTSSFYFHNDFSYLTHLCQCFSIHSIVSFFLLEYGFRYLYLHLFFSFHFFSWSKCNHLSIHILIPPPTSLNLITLWPSLPAPMACNSTMKIQALHTCTLRSLRSCFYFISNPTQKSLEAIFFKRKM